jgi:hypothetical protein
MPYLTESQFRFQIKLALQKVPRSALRDLLGKPEAHERGLVAATEIVRQHFTGYQLLPPERRSMDFGDMGAARRGPGDR